MLSHEVVFELSQLSKLVATGKTSIVHRGKDEESASVPGVPAYATEDKQVK